MVPVGVVVMAYGTPATPDDVEAYYTHIRRGRPPTADQLANLTMRYDALGGTSTLARRTRDQVTSIAAALDQRSPGRYLVRLGQKHASPFIEEAVADLVAVGATEIVGLVLAPHYSGASVGEYQARAADAARAAGDLPFTPIARWHDEPAYRDFLGAAVREALADMPDRTEVVFTAHSLPERVLEGDPYPDELWESAEAVALTIGLDPSAFSQAWQSAGATPEPWRGPDILDVIREVAASRRADAVLVCPQGFVADHLEVAYDLDIEAASLAREVGIGFARTRVLNDDPVVMSALAERVLSTS